MAAVASQASTSTPSTTCKKIRKHYLKSTRHRPPNDSFDWTPFRAAEKRYKARFPPPDLSHAIDFALMDASRAKETVSSVWKGKKATDEVREVGLKAEGRSVKAYTLKETPGLIILPGYLSQQQQRELVRWSLSEHSKWPNETNLDIHYDIPREGIWSMHLQSRPSCSITQDSKPLLVQPKSSSKSTPSSATYQEPVGPRQLVSNTPASSATFAELSATPKLIPTPSSTVSPATASELLPRLRWANIGWFYHWGTKQYDFSKDKVEVGANIRNVCKGVVGSVEWEDVFAKGSASDDGETEWRSWESTYEPDAGIVNFYQLKDTLMGHVDRSEVCATSPLVSISLGNAAVFLIGGLTRDIEPTPILLRSGDIVVMAGPHCRRAYHGVPRILEGTLPAHLEPTREENMRDDEWTPYGEFLANARININVRQVFPKGYNPLEEINTPDVRGGDLLNK